MANLRRDFIRQRAAKAALRICRRLGDTVTYTTAAGQNYTIYALVPAMTEKTFGPDENRIKVFVPYQVGFTTHPQSGDCITMSGSKWAIDTVTADDAEWPVSWDLDCFRWMHPSPEIDGG
jgi:hypothetical protein